MASPFLTSCELLKVKATGNSSSTPNTTDQVAREITYSSISYNFLSYNPKTGEFTESTTGVPVVTGGVITNCTLTYMSGAITDYPPQINTSTCEVSGYRDGGYGACGPKHDISTGSYYKVTPYINGEAATPVQLLFYITVDDSGPC